MDSKTYNLVGITLLESNFTRLPNIDFSKSITNKIDIDVENSIDDTTLVVKLKVGVTGINELSDNNFTFSVSYIGTWQIGSEVELPIEIFTKANAPAMLFPFIREQIAGISLKAGIEPVLLPTINFLRAIKEKATE